MWPAQPCKKRSGLIRHSGSGIHPPLLEARAHRERKAKDDRELTIQRKKEKAVAQAKY